MDLKLWLSVLILYLIPDVQSSGNHWIIDVPSTINAVEGSCVVIPCIYTYPRPKDNKIPLSWIGFWKRGNTIVSTNLPKYKVREEFKKRAQILGRLESHNCTMRLDGVRSTDIGPFYFRIQMLRYKSYSFTENTVSINVLHSPEPPSLSVEVTDQVTASCSVSHSCPSNPPRFLWSHTGIISEHSKMLNKWEWEAVSVLTFAPLHSYFNHSINCSVEFSGGNRVEASTILM